MCLFDNRHVHVCCMYCLHQILGFLVLASVVALKKSKCNIFVSWQVWCTVYDDDDFDDDDDDDDIDNDDIDDDKK